MLESSGCCATAAAAAAVQYANALKICYETITPYKIYVKTYIQCKFLQLYCYFECTMYVCGHTVQSVHCA